MKTTSNQAGVSNAKGAGHKRKDNEKRVRVSQSQLIADLAADFETFQSPEGEAYAVVPVNKQHEVLAHHEVLAVRGRAFRLHLGGLFYHRHKGKPAGEQAMREALAVVEGRALHEGAVEPIFRRVAEHGGRLYLDLCSPDWSCVEIGDKGCRVVPKAPVRFVRSPGMLPLPVPTKGGSLEPLRELCNVGSNDDFIGMVAILLSWLRPTGPFPVYAVVGEQGSCKSCRVKLMRDLVDPNFAALRTSPREERDLLIAASNGHVVCLDNLSTMPQWLSDSLCRLASGGGFGTRRLYTDLDEVLVHRCSPVAFTSIEQVAVAGDLLERALLASLESIPDSRRMEESELTRRFEAERPGMLGALLAIASQGLRDFPSTKLDSMPRMADFARWVSACEGACPWKRGGFMLAFNGAQREAVETSLDADLVASALRRMMSTRVSPWRGTPSQLLGDLGAVVKKRERKSKAWPKSAAWLTRKLNRPASFLRRVGIGIEQGHDGSDRWVEITNSPVESRENGVNAVSGVQTQETTALAANDIKKHAVRMPLGINPESNGILNDTNGKKKMSLVRKPSKISGLTASNDTNAISPTPYGEDGEGGEVCDVVV